MLFRKVKYVGQAQKKINHSVLKKKESSSQYCQTNQLNYLGQFGPVWDIFDLV
jgi:hypothetical protein